MTKKQTLSQLETNHLCLLCESKSLQAFTSLNFLGVWSPGSPAATCGSVRFASLLPSVFPPLLGPITHSCTTWYHHHGQPPASLVGGTDVRGIRWIPGPRLSQRAPSRAVGFLCRSMPYEDRGGNPFNVKAAEGSLACSCLSHCCIGRFCRVFRGRVLQLVVCLTVFPWWTLAVCHSLEVRSLGSSSALKCCWVAQRQVGRWRNVAWRRGSRPGAQEMKARVCLRPSVRSWVSHADPHIRHLSSCWNQWDLVTLIDLFSVCLALRVSVVGDREQHCSFPWIDVLGTEGRAAALAAWVCRQATRSW